MPTTLTRTYLSSTRSVLDEARRLQRLLDRDPAAAEVAADELAAAAARQDAGGDTYLAFMFSQTRSAPGGAASETIEELLAGAVAELQVANVLLAAGQATGENGVSGQPRLLEQAIAELEGTIDAFDRVGASSSGRLGFSAEGPQRTPQQWPDDAAAAEGFRQSAEVTLALVVTGSGEVVSSMVEKLGELVPDSVTDAMAKLGKEVEGLPKAGRVLRLGLRKLEKVLNLLSRIVGDDVAVWLQGHVQTLWEKVRSGELVPAALARMFDVVGVRADVDEAVRLRTADRAALDRGADELAALQGHFRSALKTVRTLVAAAGLALVVAGVVAPFVAALAAALAGISAVVYLLIISVVVLLGMDYVDARLDLRRIDGVRSIAARLSA